MIFFPPGNTLVIQLTRPVYLWRSIRTPQLADGQWHHLNLEVSSGQVRVQVDAESHLYNVDSKPSDTEDMNKNYNNNNKKNNTPGQQNIQLSPRLVKGLYVGGRPK